MSANPIWDFYAIGKLQFFYYAFACYMMKLSEILMRASSEIWTISHSTLHVLIVQLGDRIRIWLFSAGRKARDKVRGWFGWLLFRVFGALGMLAFSEDLIHFKSWNWMRGGFKEFACSLYEWQHQPLHFIALLWYFLLVECVSGLSSAVASLLPFPLSDLLWAVAFVQLFPVCLFVCFRWL